MSHIDRWTVNESLLQSYRSIFISSQSFLLTAGAVFTGKSPAILYAVAFTSLAIIWIVWFPVVRARLYIVDYYKYAATLSSENASHLCSEQDYVRNADHRANANRLFSLKSNWRTTRIKMDIVLPVLFTALWLMIVVHEKCAG